MRETSLRVLQILSLASQIMIRMIDLDVIRWVVNLLKTEGNVLSDNNLEYATALLMNLTLRSQGKKKCEELDTDILKVLNEHLEHENNQVRTYVNGTLYSVLESKKLRDEAKALGLDTALEYLLKNSEQNFQRQIEYVLSRLNKDEEEDAKSQSSDEEVDEEDEIDLDDDDSEIDEVEYDEYEDMYQGTDVDGEPRGEDWLMSQFIADNEQADEQNQFINIKIDEYEALREQIRAKQAEEMPMEEEENPSEVKLRPTTPMKKPPQTPGKGQGPFEVTLTTNDIKSQRNQTPSSSNNQVNHSATVKNPDMGMMGQKDEDGIIPTEM